MFLSLHQLVTKNQKLNMYLCTKFHCFDLGRLFFFLLLQQQKSKQINFVFHIWFLVIGWTYTSIPFTLESAPPLDVPAHENFAYIPD